MRGDLATVVNAEAERVMAEKTQIELYPENYPRVPNATSEQALRSMIEAAVLQERARCIQVVRDEIAKWDSARGLGWSWTKVRDAILEALGALER